MIGLGHLFGVQVDDGLERDGPEREGEAGDPAARVDGGIDLLVLELRRCLLPTTHCNRPLPGPKLMLVHHASLMSDV